MRSCQISYIFRNFGPRRFRRQEMRHRIDSGHWKQRLLHRTSRSHRKMGRRAQRCQRGRHRCRVGRFWRQRSLGFHQNRIRQTSRQEFASSRFLHVSFTFKNIKKTWIKRFKRFEKHFGGKYLGEIVRCILVRLTEEGILFGGNASDQLLRHGAFTTRYVSLIDQ